jgi:predicted patatin/cPLA2 family phospholipase
MADHPVLAAIARRMAGAGPGGDRIALVVEGGGMRGVVSSAMAAAIEELRLLDAFDLVVGTSAGALNAAALVAGVAAGCTEEYAEGFVSRAFINPARLLVGRPAVDVDYVLSFNSHRLDPDRHARTVASRIPLYCVATDVERCAAADLSGFADLGELRAALLASSRLPWIGGEPVAFRGRRWLDGGLSEPVPVPTALAAGATHVLVLLTRPRGARVETGGSLGDRLVERHLRALNPRLVDVYRGRGAAYAELTDRVFAATAGPADSPPYLMGIALPPGSPVPARLERDPRRLRAAAELGRRCALDALAPASRDGRSG